jgi:hypothetical protein
LILHGSLHGYTLSDLFGLLVRQKASGNLELFTEHKEGILFFKDGMIAGALNDEELLSEKLFFLVSDTCHYPISETAHLFTEYREDMTGLCDEIIRRNLLSEPMLKSFVLSVIEDIVCRFFLWKSGTYHFSTDVAMDAAGVCPAWLALSPDKMSMEATRRFDEWRRIKLHIDPDAVYAPTHDRPRHQPANLHLHLSTTDLVLSKIDGVAPVSSIIRTSSLTNFKTYEAINTLLAESRIRPIERRAIRPFARPRPGRERRSAGVVIPAKVLSSIMLVVGIIAVTIVLGRFVLHGVVLADLESAAARARLELPAAETMQQIEFASFLFDGSKGASPQPADLRKAGLLTGADLRPAYELGAIAEASHGGRPAP